MKKIFFAFSIFTFITIPFFVHSQELVPVSLNIRVTNSHLIVEGQVVSKRSFWDDNHQNIFTASKVEVYKVFKGNLDSGYIEIVTPGGTVSFVKEEVHPSLDLDLNEVGVFMLQNNSVLTKKNNNIDLFEPVASVQGFVKYDLINNSAANIFDRFNNIDQVFYPKLENLTGRAYTEIEPFSVIQSNTDIPEANPSISGFSPSAVTAGTKTMLTINGNNFGATPGYVGFANADDGGASYSLALSTQIISWSNTQIIVEVPAKAGTGTFLVRDSGGTNGFSATSLSVSYAEINANYDPGTGTEAYQTQHSDRNSNGGYTWQMFTDFDANTNANASFMRAFNTWTSCTGTGINWTIGAVTTTDVVANDGINIIRHDNGTELPNGILGRCTSRFTGCSNGSGSLDWYVSELDIVFDDGTNWNYSTSAPAFSEYDFETVAVHELGHAHQLAHVISPGAIMHYAIANGTHNRTLGINDLAGGNDVMSRSTTSVVCSQGLMTELPCLLKWDGGAFTSNWTDANNWSTDAVPTSTDEVFLDNTYVSGNYSINIGSAQVIEDLDIDMGVNTITLSGGNNLEITGIVTPTSGTLNSNGQLVLKATNSTSYGQVAAGVGSISGNVVNEWYFDGASGYRHIASPVVCDLTELSDDFDIINFTSDATGSIWNWNATTRNWTSPAGGSLASFNNGVSVFMGTSNGSDFSTLPLTLDVEGTIVTGNQSQSLVYGTGGSSPVVFANGSDGWNFVYNPYPSAIQWSLVEADGSYPPEIASTYYYYDKNIAPSGGYASYNPNSGTGINGATDFIAKGKAFWVQASSSPSSSLSFTDAMRTALEQPLLKTNSNGVSNEIVISTKSALNEDFAFYGEFFNATDKYDLEFDHLKMKSLNTTQVYINNATNSLAYNVTEKYEYPLPFTVNSSETGKIQVNVSIDQNFIGAKPKFIQDLTTGELYRIEEGTFEVYASEGVEYPFAILQKRTDGIGNIKPLVYTQEGIIGINLKGSNAFTHVEVLDISGRTIKFSRIESNFDRVEFAINKSGVFVVQVTNSNGNRFIEKVVLVN